VEAVGTGGVLSSQRCGEGVVVEARPHQDAWPRVTICGAERDALAAEPGPWLALAWARLSPSKAGQLGKVSAHQSGVNGLHDLVGGLKTPCSKSDHQKFYLHDRRRDTIGCAPLVGLRGVRWPPACAQEGAADA